jgi:DDE superfamily endonuclease
MDEKGFLIGICHASKRIVSVKSIKTGQCKGVIQDGSREFITCLACISAIGEKISPSLIYQSDSGDMQDTWLEDFDFCNQHAYFALSPKGWTSDEHGLRWLDRFNEQTSKIVGNTQEKRLLILDGHSSHVTMAFLQKAMAVNILVVIFPPHSTHRLQPLDVSVFSPLANYYSQELDNYIQRTRGYSRMTKRVFWSIFWPSWQKGVRKDTILSGFKKTGIHPFNPPIVLSQVAPIVIEDSSSDDEGQRTIKTAREVRKLVKEVRNTQQVASSNIERLIQSVEEMSIENELLRHEIGLLSSTLITERKRRKRGQALGLPEQEEPKFGQFYSPMKIQRKLDELKAKEVQQEQEKQQKADDKLQAQILRDESAKANRERIENNKRERDRKRAETLAKKEQK